ncbi:RagB/SusD family nutrient uptake outer membrane protein [Chitinophaga silvisoli]|uniref:RagB/SusD family nutrient uptake outer membrane protein n=1 Tax=Chitinophaga silvisoli TaxID=2291814 RepID=A0A3E1P0L3_9BACT|nr:RagB/SusD family nutrient uptake outer membrane protein [Chitinophaga silvisoli]RFM33727.1 RagB/SusD family nutrient uptake outer membrane protein [Chitinophaga silvisoli]
MKRMKYLLLCVPAFFACNKELDVDKKGSYTTANYWRNESDAVDGITGIYNILLEEDFTGFGEFVYDNCSDDQYRAGDHPELADLEAFTYDASNAAVKAPWKWKYEMLNRSNSALLYIPAITNISADVKNRCLGEAHFFRAFAYWRLALIYGDVPMIMEEDIKNGTYNKAKSTIDEVHAQIEADLKAAAILLPESYDASQAGRVSKGAAWGLLAKLYLYENDFANTILYGDSVITNANYALQSTYAANFTPATSNNSEMLLNVQTLDGWGYSDFITYHAPRAWGGWDFFEPVQGLLDEFEDGDPRKDVCIMKPGDVINIGTGTATYTASLSSTGYHYNKFCAWISTGGLNYSFKYPLMRTSDIYLCVAEAKIRQTGAGAGDAEINALRSRVGLTPVSNAGMTALMHERRVELCGENERHQDLMRWDKAGIIDITTIYNKPKLTSSGAVIQAARTFTRPKNYYFPLPQSEIDKSNGVLVQNSNY